MINLISNNNKSKTDYIKNQVHPNIVNTHTHTHTKLYARIFL